MGVKQEQILGKTRHARINQLMKRVGRAYQEVSMMGSESELSEVLKCFYDVFQAVDRDLALRHLRGDVTLHSLACAISEQQARFVQNTSVS